PVVKWYDLQIDAAVVIISPTIYYRSSGCSIFQDMPDGILTIRIFRHSEERNILIDLPEQAFQYIQFPTSDEVIVVHISIGITICLLLSKEAFQFRFDQIISLLLTKPGQGFCQQ